MKSNLLFIFFYFTALSTFAQYSIEANYIYGKTVKHNFRFTVPINSHTHGFEILGLKKTIGDKYWHKLYKYPEYGIGINHFNLGNATTLGNLSAAYFTLHFNIINKKKWNSFIRLGAGGSYISKHYNIIENTENTAIGSSYNNFFLLKIGTRIHISEKLLFNIIAGATHISNSRYAMPNLGANTIMLNAGLSYNFHKKIERNNLFEDSTFIPNKKWQINFRTDATINESGAPNGPKYISYIFNTGLTKQLNSKYNIYITIESMYSKVTKYFILQSEQGVQPDINAINIAPYIGGEMMLGNFGLNFHIGYYVLAYEKAGIIPTKIGVNYYMLKYGKNKNHTLYSSINMRSHFAIADFISLGLGTKL